MLGVSGLNIRVVKVDCCYTSVKDAIIMLKQLNIPENTNKKALRN